MEEQNNRNEKPDKIVFESEDGNEEFYVLEQTMLGGVNYILVTDDVDSEEGSFLVLKEENDSADGFASYEIPEDENELKSVIAIFNELLDDYDLEV
ncbi:MAG: DUF1292 domain-containing protein [Wujia sp.]